MRIVLVGPPGSGKSSQGARIAERLGVPHLSTGELVRAEVDAGTPLGSRVADIVARGDLVPDDLMVEVVAAALAAAPGDGYVLDGFPRTPVQATELARDGSAVGAPDLAVHLAVPDRVAEERLAHRAGEEGRADDFDPAVTRRRLDVYARETAPLLDHYRRQGRLVTVDGDQPPDAVTEATMSAIGSHARRR